MPCVGATLTAAIGKRQLVSEGGWHECGSPCPDCMPNPLTAFTGPGLDSTHASTTGSASLPLPQLTCAFGIPCTCGLCTGDASVACSSNADCAAAAAGTCAGDPGDYPNNCNDGTCTPDGNGEGVCASGPDDKFCDGIVRANGKGFLSCQTNYECSADVLGQDVGGCTLTEPRRCFPDSIAGTGTASPSAPQLASAYCSAPSVNGFMNTALGLPGPVKLQVEGTTTFRCAGNPGITYPSCP